MTSILTSEWTLQTGPEMVPRWPSQTLIDPQTGPQSNGRVEMTVIYSFIDDC